MNIWENPPEIDEYYHGDVEFVRHYLRLTIDRLYREHRALLGLGRTGLAMQIWRIERITPMVTMLRALERTEPARIRNRARKEATR